MRSAAAEQRRQPLEGLQLAAAFQRLKASPALLLNEQKSFKKQLDFVPIFKNETEKARAPTQFGVEKQREQAFKKDTFVVRQVKQKTVMIQCHNT
jgi:hypothetical protein